MDTGALSHSTGLMGYDIGGIGQQVGLFRNCVCGTTIMAFCHDRRDSSPAGDKRRALFGELMNRLVDTGTSAEDARLRLLEALRSEPVVAEFRKAEMPKRS